MNRTVKNYVRRASTLDIDAIIAVERAAWGSVAATRRQIASRIYHYAPGNPVYCLGNGKVVGYGSTMILSELPRGNFSWEEVTDGGTAENHVPSGRVLYGISASVIPGTVMGVMDQLVKHCVLEGAKRGCRKLSLGSRVPGFDSWNKKTGKNILAYLNERTSAGRPIDPELALYEKSGFTIEGRALRNYFPCPGSHNCGALISMPTSLAK